MINQYSMIFVIEFCSHLKKRSSKVILFMMSYNDVYSIVHSLVNNNNGYNFRHDDVDV